MLYLYACIVIEISFVLPPPSPLDLFLYVSQLASSIESESDEERSAAARVLGVLVLLPVFNEGVEILEAIGDVGGHSIIFGSFWGGVNR